MSENVKTLPIKFKAHPKTEEPMLQVVETSWTKGECNHSYRIEGGRSKPANYLIRQGETEVECGLCGTRLDPMFVLMKLAREESQWNRTREQYQEEMKRLRERSRTKCQHCGGMTRISR